ncbi:MAG: hypothetical protein WC835_00560 [Candidatus Paceibacterota bacterium]|jgi:hypothetical protein
MPNLEEQPKQLRSKEFRKMELDRTISLLEEDFSTNQLRGPDERKLIERVLSPKAGGKISGRTALTAEKALAGYVSRLRQENRELAERIERRENVNEGEAEERIRKNDKEIAMIEGNCLTSLGEINDTILFPEDK